MKKTRLMMLAVVSVSVIIIAISAAISYHQTRNSTFVQEHDVMFFWVSGCLECSAYIDDIMKPALVERGHDDFGYIDLSSIDGRAKYKDFAEARGIPLQYMLKPAVSIDDRVYLEGYLPERIVKDVLLQEQNITGKLLVVYDIDLRPGYYRAWDLKSGDMEYSSGTPISTYLQWLNHNPGTSPPQKADVWDFLPLVVVGGLIDGINPCAFAVILFFITFLYSTKAGRDEVIDVGISYIVVIYLVYFLIGIALFQALKLIGFQEYIIIAAAIAIAIIGAINIRDSLSKKREPLIKISKRSKKRIQTMVRGASVPTAVALAIFVSITEFACTGAIYLVVITLLSSSTTYFQGMALLIIYNIMFIVPLLIILILASNRTITGQMRLWRDQEKRNMRLSLGIGMILLGGWSVALKWSPVATVLITMGLVIDLAFAILVYLRVKNKVAKHRKQDGQEPSEDDQHF